MEDAAIALVVIPTIFLGLPSLILHHVTKWKTAAPLTNDDERMLGDMYELARRLEERMKREQELAKKREAEKRAKAEAEAKAKLAKAEPTPTPSPGTRARVGTTA